MPRTGLAAAAVLALQGASAQSQGPDPIHGWGYSSFGTPGLIDMPSAHSRPDGELALTLSHLRNQSRAALSFQISDRLSASFRYAALYHVRPNPGDGVTDYRFDRSFSLHYRLLDEGEILPAIAIGLNDIVGTGFYGGEYLVATKTLTPRLRATVGLGWGRLGSLGSFDNPLSALSQTFDQRSRDQSGLGGKFTPGAWFHGEAALFGGIEWQASDRLRLVAEYSSDDYRREDGSAFERRSPLNFGLDWAVSDRTYLAARALYGSALGVQLAYALHPAKSRHGSGREQAPQPIRVRGATPDRDMSAPGARAALERDLSRALAAEGLALLGMTIQAERFEIAIANDRYSQSSQALGRAARVMTALAPDSVEWFDMVLTFHGMPVTRVALRRADLERLEHHPVAPDLLRATTRIDDTRHLPERLPAASPRFDYGLAPYLTPSLFDPDSPLRLDFGLALTARYQPAPGIVLTGRLQHRLAGNLAEGDRASTSVLRHVRSDLYEYYKGGATTLPELTASAYFRPGDNLFGRVTAGYLERMYGGVSAELLWKPQNSALALGFELNHIRQREFDSLFGFRGKPITTGHLSAYYEFTGGYQAQLDLGRYLAGDIGATLTLAREFGNGWRIGAFATRTNISAEDFGEGSFDKGILLTIPLDWLSGQPSKAKIDQVIRPVLRDGGARLTVPGRLYGEVRGQQASALDANWGRFWK